MKLLDNIRDSYLHIPYTWNHKKALIRLEKEFTSKNTFRILLHDTDKLIMYSLLPVLSLKQHSFLHKKFHVHHHYDDIPTASRATRQEMILDWESARYTKPDKPLPARQFIMVRFPDKLKYFEDVLNDWGL